MVPIWATASAIFLPHPDAGPARNELVLVACSKVWVRDLPEGPENLFQAADLWGRDAWKRRNAGSLRLKKLEQSDSRPAERTREIEARNGRTSPAGGTAPSHGSGLPEDSLGAGPVL